MKTPFPTLPDIAPRPGKPSLDVAADGTVTVEAAAEYFDCDAKRLRGWIFRNQLHDPIGNLALGTVLAFSVERYLAQQAKLFKDEHRD